MRRADFLRVSERGRRINARYFLILVLERRTSEPELRGCETDGSGTAVPAEEAAEWACLRLGITVTRRVGKAVRRNRIKRLVREWFRSSQERLQRDWRGYDLVVIAKREIPELGLAAVKADLDRALLERSAGRAISRPDS